MTAPGEFQRLQELSGTIPLTVDAPAPGERTISVDGMAALVSITDWAATPLGPRERWPQSLKTAVNICLDSRYPILIWWGPELVKVYNDAYAVMLGAKHPAALGAPGQKVWPEIWGIIGPMLHGVIERGEATWSENQMLPLHRRGFSEECYFTFSYSPIRDESGGIGGVFTAVAETTKQVLAERRLSTLRSLGQRAESQRTVEEACRASREVLAGNAADVAFARIILAAEAASDDTWPVAEVMKSGKPKRMAMPESAGTVRSVWGDPVTEAMVLPIVNPGQDDAFGVLVVGLSPRLAVDSAYQDFLSLAAGHLATAISTATAYEEERHRTEALAELNRAKTAFFSNVSHEFRTPLTLLLGPVTDLLASKQHSAQDRQSLELVERNALRLLKLVNTLLDFSRLEAGRMQPRFGAVDLGELTADVASAFRSTLERGGLELRVECARETTAYVDRAMWEKIVLNLLSNAFKHTFEGSIAVQLRAEGKRAVLSVTDTGIGIAPDQATRVFERFHQVPSAWSRTHEGSGIGLSLVRELVQLHGGEVAVTSEVGKGSTFTVTIPLGSEHLPAEHVHHERLPIAPEGAAADAIVAPFVAEAARWVSEPVAQIDAANAEYTPLAASHILVVDDNADMRDYISRLLAGAGARVTIATDGREALDVLRAGAEPDVVLSDVMMPGMDGFSLLAAIRADERLRPTPVILLSARAGEESRVGGIAAGADDYLIKPFIARELLARVASQLRLARASGAERKARSDADEARRHTSQVFEQAPVPICVIENEELRYTFANASYRQIIGNRDPVGKTLLELWPELDGSEIHRVFQRVFSAGEPVAAREFKVQFDQFGTGEKVDAFFNFVYHPLHDGPAKTRGIIAVATDVTPQVLARREAERLKAAAEAANEAKLHLLRTVSHETRQPVHASLGYLDLLAMGIRGELTDAQRGDIENIRRNQTHLLGLLNDILSYAKLEAGALELESDVVEAHDVIAAVEPMVAPQFIARGVTYVVKPLPATARGTFRGDPERTVQVVINLLTNALKATEPGGTVTLSCETVNDTVAFTVSDTGVGIPESKLEEIFDPFTQLARVRSHRDSQSGGVGLGLSISRQLARAMQGDVTVTSEVGVGSTFTFTLPAVVNAR